MKSLKKVLAFALAVVMVFSFASFAGAYTDDAQIQNSSAVNILSELGVIKGFPAGDFRPEEPVTRGELAKMIAVILSGGTEDPSAFKTGDTGLTDITWHWAKAYITHCYLLGIISGYGNGEFGPDDSVTVEAAAKMILTALGYDADLEGLVGPNWAGNTNDLANTAALYEGVTQEATEAATRDTIALMLYNMLVAKTVSYTDGSSRIEGDIAAYSYFGISVIEGVVVANEVAGLGGAPLPEGQTEVYILSQTGGEPLIQRSVSSDTGSSLGYAMNPIGGQVGAALSGGKGTVQAAIYDGEDKHPVWENGTFIFNVSTDKGMVGVNVTLFYRQADKKIIGDPTTGTDIAVINATGPLESFEATAKAAGLSYDADSVDIFVNLEEPAGWQSAADHELFAYYCTVKDGKTEFALGGSTEGMSIRLLDINDDQKVDLVLIEIGIISSVTQIETRDGVTYYTFGSASLAYDGGKSGAVPADSVVTEDTLKLGDYVEVIGICGLYYVTKLESATAEVSAKTATKPGASVTVSDGAKYPASDLPIDKTAVKNAVTLEGLKIGSTYTLYFDPSGNFAFAKTVTSGSTSQAITDDSEEPPSYVYYTIPEPNGRATTDSFSYREGATVTITPWDGYSITSVTYKTASGTFSATVATGGLRAYFTMPGKNVTAIDVSTDLRTYTINFDYNDDGATPPGSTTYTIEDSYVYMPYPSIRTGYYFDGWYKSGGTQVQDFTAGTYAEDMNLTAKWVKTYTLYLYGRNALAFSGDKLVVTATVNGVSDSTTINSSSGPNFITVDADTTVTVTLTHGGGHSSTLTATLGSAQFDTAANLAISISSSGSITDTFTMTAADTLTLSST